MTARLEPRQQTWMNTPALRKVIASLRAKGDVRFVGGAVRNALIDAPVLEVDLATPLTPDVVSAALTAAGLQAVPTGIEHGTVTAIADGVPFEITSLRRDVSTDGRRASVAFTTDWKEDAGRRDFTINALYATPEGDVFDYFDGLSDLKAGHVRFVGDPATRIREDYLRILRLFRFHAWYGRGALDADAFQAAVANKSGLKSLSGERVQKEILKLLAAPDPIPALRAMREYGLFHEIFPPTALPSRSDLKRLGNLLPLTAVDAAAADPVLRLAALILLFTKDAVREVAALWRLSNADRDRIVALSGNYAMPSDENEAKRRLYKDGPDIYRDWLLLTHAAIPHAVTGWQNYFDLPKRWQAPRLPLDGGDVMKLGIAQGPRIGALLNDIEQWWAENGFAATRDELLNRLRAKAGEG